MNGEQRTADDAADPVGGVYPRWMHDRLLTLLAEEPVVQLVGPRACGKSFTSSAVVEELGGTVLRLDDPAERDVAAADPTAYLRGRVAPVLIDEGHDQGGTVRNGCWLPGPVRSSTPGRWPSTCSSTVPRWPPN